jgi:hypothetical protein
MTKPSVDFYLQLFASITTLIGVAYGTTNTEGILIYLCSQVSWWIIMWRGKLWGLLPLNAAMVGVLFYNLWKALSLT